MDSGLATSSRPGMTSGEACVLVLAQLSRRVLLIDPPSNKRGRREDRVLAAPMAPVRKKCTGQEPQVRAGASRPSLRDGVTAYTRSPRGSAFLPPSPRVMRKHHRQGLASAPGCQDHTTSPSATRRSSAQTNCARRVTSTAFPSHATGRSGCAPRVDMNGAQRMLICRILQEMNCGQCRHHRRSKCVIRKKARVWPASSRHSPVRQISR